MSPKTQKPEDLSRQPCPRPRLDALFDEAFQKQLVVVHGGAGFGKTTAVTQYLAGAGYRTVWFPFAPPDNVPARFWEHLTRVFARHRPGLGGKMEVLGFPETLRAFGNFLGDLTEELYEDNQTVAFVFDDFQAATDPVVQDFLLNLIAARLENSSIVLISRTWPVFEKASPVVPFLIGPRDLRFTEEETAACLARQGLRLDGKAAAKIHRYVSGWPIALSLVAMAVKRGDESVLEGISLANTKTALHTLFEQEIFSQYSAAEQDLLIKLSVLDSFPRGLVRAVTGEPERDIAQLLDGNLFIRYDADAMRLFFHPLYHEFLREKLRGMEKGEREDTYCKAADWCRDNGFYYDAANYYRQCGAHEELWNTLLRIDAVRHSRSEADFFIGQIGQLPDAFVRENPMTRILLAVMYVNNLRFAEAGQVLDEVQAGLEAAPQTGENQKLLGEYFVARGFLTLAREENGFDECFKKASGLLPEGSRRWGGKLMLVDMGPGLNLQSARARELEKSLACFARGVPYMARVLNGTGEGLDTLCQCEALFLTGDAKAATEPAYQALYKARAAAQHDIVGNALFMLLRIYTSLGDYTQIQNVIDHVKAYAAEHDAQNLGIWDITRAWLYTEVGEVEKVAWWIRSPSQTGFAPISVERPLLLRQRCLIAAGQNAEALALLEQFEALGKGKNAVLSLLYVTLGRAVAQDQLGHRREATAALKEAYGLAKGNKLFMPFIEYGNRTRLLMEHVRQTTGHGLPGDWLDDMHAKASTYAKRHAYIAGRYRAQQEGQLVDYHLSRRETELLSNLSQGLTREEIADSMQLSLNTVKSMTKQTFAKLGAINAADAVRIAIVNQLI